jgi:hypothetical protein
VEKPQSLFQSLEYQQEYYLYALFH